MTPTSLIIIAAVALFAIILLVRTLRRGGSASSDEGKQIYVGNLPYRASDNDIKSFFSEYGNVDQVRIVKNHSTGRSRGYAFVTMSSVSEANKALKGHGQELKGRSIVVRIAKSKPTSSRDE